MKVYSFSRGGLRFEDDFAPGRVKSWLAFLPEMVIVPLAVEAGSRSIPVVSEGRDIEEGMLIARRQGSGSANVHSPIPGKLVKTIKWAAAPGFLSDAFVIKLGGSFNRLGKPEVKHEWTDLNWFELRSLLDEYGVIEMDGLGRPLCDIFSKNNMTDAPITLIVRCVFDEPWLAAEYCLCKERTEAVAEGCLITARAAGASSVVFAVSAAERELGRALLEAAKRNAASGQITFAEVLTGSRYPQRSDYAMKAVMTRYAKRGGPVKGGLLTLGPATMAAVYDAVVFRVPVLERHVAVGGPALKHRAVVKARIGSRLRDLVAECGGFTGKTEEESAVATIGSPLMGRAAASLDEPVLKTSRSVFVSAAKRRGVSGKKNFLLSKIGGFLPEASCINCGECRSVCPLRLDPEDLYKTISCGRRGMVNSNCIGCGCCEAVCPSKLPLCTAIVRTPPGGDARAV
ncbi:MAG: 4Fe-4S dicluster domain-containing protein [Spirochaetaceae bacterium]|jgi:electron transport complex protein RnfC|nr:4Fe-4S dicluster domain-containing protein [Spirochaetaceae bacterium]